MVELHLVKIMKMVKSKKLKMKKKKMKKKLKKKKKKMKKMMMTQVLCISYHGELQFEVQPLADILPPPYFVEHVPGIGVAGSPLGRGGSGDVSSRRSSPDASVANNIGARVRRRRFDSRKPAVISSSGVIHISDEEVDVGASGSSPVARGVGPKGKFDQGSSAVPHFVLPPVSEGGPDEGVSLFAGATRGLEAIQAQLGAYQRVVAERDSLRFRVGELEGSLGEVPEFAILVERLCAASFAAGEAIGRRDGPEAPGFVDFGPFDDPSTVMGLLLGFKRI